MTNIHIHQGGTLQAYCGLNIAGGAWAEANLARPHVLRALRPLLVSWEEASRASCPDCRSHFVGHGLDR